MSNEIRSEKHRRNIELEKTLECLQSLIEPVELEKIKDYKFPKLPVIFIVGCARSGSTLLLQYLAETKLFAYPSNLISRFYYAPVIGAMIQRVLVDLDFKNELLGESMKLENAYGSTLGKTEGALSPNEFWYFWRRFFVFNDIQKISSVEISQEVKQVFLRELAGIQEIFRKPIVMKGMIMNWEIPLLADFSDNFYFIHIKRDVVSNAVSLLNARKEYYSDVSKWYSFKPPNYQSLTELAPEEQVLHQVLETNKEIEEGLSAIGSTRSFCTTYEDFCTDPVSILEKMDERFLLDLDIENMDRSLTFNISNKNRSEEHFDSVMKAYDKIKC